MKFIGTLKVLDGRDSIFFDLVATPYLSLYLTHDRNPINVCERNMRIGESINLFLFKSD